MWNFIRERCSHAPELPERGQDLNSMTNILISFTFNRSKDETRLSYWFDYLTGFAIRLQFDTREACEGTACVFIVSLVRRLL
jgi:hypothetical protein